MLDEHVVTQHSADNFPKIEFSSPHLAPPRSFVRDRADPSRIRESNRYPLLVSSLISSIFHLNYFYERRKARKMYRELIEHLEISIKLDLFSSEKLPSSRVIFAFSRNELFELEIRYSSWLKRNSARSEKRVLEGEVGGTSAAITRRIF